MPQKHSSDGFDSHNAQIFLYFVVSKYKMTSDVLEYGTIDKTLKSFRQYLIGKGFDVTRLTKNDRKVSIK